MVVMKTQWVQSGRTMPERLQVSRSPHVVALKLSRLVQFQFSEDNPGIPLDFKSDRNKREGTKSGNKESGIQR